MDESKDAPCFDKEQVISKDARKFYMMQILFALVIIGIYLDSFLAVQRNEALGLIHEFLLNNFDLDN